MSGSHSRFGWLVVLVCLVVLALASTAEAEACTSSLFPPMCRYVSCPDICSGCVIENGQAVPTCEDDGNASAGQGSGSSGAKPLSQGAIAGICIGAVVFCTCLAGVEQCCRHGGYQAWVRSAQQNRPVTLRQVAVPARTQAAIESIGVRRAVRLARAKAKHRAVVASIAQASALQPLPFAQPATGPMYAQQVQLQPMYGYAVQPALYDNGMSIPQPEPLPPSYAEVVASSAPPPAYAQPPLSHSELYQPRETLQMPESAAHEQQQQQVGDQQMGLVHVNSYASGKQPSHLYFAN